MSFTKSFTAGLSETHQRRSSRHCFGRHVIRYARITGANDRVRVAICGVRGPATITSTAFRVFQAQRLPALCDVDETVSNHRLGDIEKLGLPRPKSYVDVRKLLEEKILMPFHRRAQSLARANGHLGVPGRKRCVCRKAVLRHNWF